MNISQIFIIRPIATSLLMLAILLSGALSFQFLPISSLPEVDYPTIQVSTFYPGASPKVMATSVTAPLERQFGQMPGLNQMLSSSSQGSALITLQFTLDISLDVAEQEVQAAINAASGYLPSGIPNPPVYSKVNPADTPIITLALTSKNLPLYTVEDIAETRLAQKISQLSGVGLVSISGGQRPAIRIQANPKLLASYGLSTSDIRTAITNANVNAAKGSFDGPSVAYTIDSNDQLLSSADYANIIIAYQNNAPVRLSDVSNVIDDVENVKQAAWINKEEAIILNIQRQPGANVIQVADNIKALLPKLEATLPSDINLSIVSDRTITIRASIDDVEFELILAVILVIIIIYCFLRSFSATIIPSLAVPLSLIGTLGIIYLLGFSINNLTLMALTIATGFVVDDAIVMIENITRYIEMGEKPLAAALKGAKQIGFTIISLTISLIAVLIPLFFMEDVIGRLFKEFSMTLGITILVSAFISLSLTPMLCAKILKNHEEIQENKFTQILEKSLSWLIEKYRVSLKVILSHQKTTLFVAILTLILTAYLFIIIPKGFFPIQDTGMIQGISVIKSDTSFSNMAKKQQELIKQVLDEAEVDSISSFIGIDGTNITENSGRMLINLKDIAQRNKTADEVIASIKEKLANSGSGELYMQPVQDLSIDDTVSRSKYQYSISSHDSADVSHYASLLVEELQKSPKLANVTNDTANPTLSTYIEINRDTAALLGVTMQNITDALYDIFGQRQVSTIFTERNQYHVVLEGSALIRNTEAKYLEDIYVKSATGNMVPIKSFAKISKKPSSLLIARQNQFPVENISFDLAKNISLGDAVQVFDEAKKKLAIPEEIQTSFQGTALSFTNSANNEVWLILAAIIVVYIVLGVLYESYIHPVTILSTLPSACMGALIALFLCNKELDVVSVIGIILLIGIVKKNAIMMIDFALEQQRVHKKTPEEAIFEACILRFRPILMTSFAALFGAVPLVLGHNIGHEIREPLGITIIGGLILSQILTLYTTPVIYLAFDRLSKKDAKEE